ncbi:MAG TPA: HAMP domain-containing sensor histidine kinase, partial [Polyangiaceae bacterium LLY-WYZ-15_(1-7)]|nr:HAMP domain-containing sensor histidine kinase [Polyangiaceae bacterium LLY-WYZ-15_(1-7)]
EALEGALRLVDGADVDAGSVRLRKALPERPPPPDELAALRLELLASDPDEALQELQRQNAELVRALHERERYEQALGASEERLRLAAEAAGLGTWELERGHLLLSERAGRLLDLPERAPLDAVVARLDEGEAFREALAELEAEGTPLGLTSGLRQREAWVAFDGSRLRSRDGHRIIGTAVDVTERQHLLEEARLRLEFEEQLIGIVSHDLKGPLGAILMGTSLLAEDLDADGQDVLGRVRRSAQRAKRLVHDLLDYTRAHLGSGIPVHRKRQDAVAVVKDAVEQARLTAPGAEIRFEHEGPARAEVDATRLAQVVDNLISNALRHGAEGRPVTVRCAREGGELVIEVHNEGEPIPEALLPRLFEPLRQGDPAEGGRASLGLGLFIVARVVEAHGGRVRVESTESAGTTFRVALPARPSNGIPQP